MSETKMLFDILGCFKPTKQRDNYLYKVNYNCAIVNKKGLGGIVELILVSPKKLEKSYLKNAIVLNQTVITTIVLQQMDYLKESLIEAKKDFEENCSCGFFGTGEPKLLGLNKEEYLREMLKNISVIDQEVPGNLSYETIHLKNEEFLKGILKKGILLN